MCRLSTKRFATLTYHFNSNPQMFLLDVFELDLSYTDGDVPRKPSHLATYQFPRMCFERFPLVVVTSSFPSSSPPFFDDDLCKPSVAAPSSGLICIKIIPRELALPTICCQVYILPTPLLTVGPDYDGTPSVHAWSSWGPPITRWIKHGVGYPSLGLKPYAYRVGTPGRILDFNPLDIARDLCRQKNTPTRSLPSLLSGRVQNVPHDDEQPPSRIVTQPTIIFSDERFREDVISSLPYRETMYDNPEGMQPSPFCFVEEDFYCIEVPFYVCLMVRIY
jgi:hypothetical protein